MQESSESFNMFVCEFCSIFEPEIGSEGRAVINVLLPDG